MENKKFNQEVKQELEKNVIMDANKFGEWISVKDKLPTNKDTFSNDVVLFWSKKHSFPMVGCYDYEFSDWTRLPWENCHDSLKFEDVTHWMPLPKPPTNEKMQK